MPEDFYDALLYISFGGPEGPGDVMPFLRKVTRGRVPEAALKRVAGKYEFFGGTSPINRHNRAVVSALEEELKKAGIDLPVYFGNRFWHPFLTDTLQKMKEDGVRRVLAFATSAYGSHYGCREYVDELGEALERVGGGMIIDKLPPFSSHPLFIRGMSELLAATLRESSDVGRQLLFTAHSIPLSMKNSRKYVEELEETARLIMGSVPVSIPYRLVFQSRSRASREEWTGPDLNDVLGSEDISRVQEIVLMPIGFLCDHMEVIYDLDIKAAGIAKERGLRLLRVQTLGTSPLYISMIRTLIEDMEEYRGRTGVEGTLGVNCPLCRDSCREN